MKTAFLTTVYPGVEPFLPDFFRSVRNQTDTNFTLVVLNDGMDSSQLEAFLPHELNHLVMETRAKTPAAIRSEGINFVKNSGFEVIIFGDADDFFDKNRVTVCKSFLQEYSLVVNELSIVDQNGKLLTDQYLSNRLDNKEEINASFLQDKNCAGLSNSAIHLDGETPDVPDNSIAFDWLFFYGYLQNEGRKAVFTNECCTYYRQHGANIIGLQEMNAQKATRGVEVKAQFYAHFSHYSDWHQHLSSEFNALRDLFKKDEDQVYNYLENILKNRLEFPLWWEEINPLG